MHWTERPRGDGSPTDRHYVMQHATQPLDCRTVPPIERVRARFWLSHMQTVALLCVVALFVVRQLRYDCGEPRRVAQIEVVLAIYGATCAIVSMARGALMKGDKLAVFGLPSSVLRLQRMWGCSCHELFIN